MTATVYGQRENMAGCHSWNTIPVKTLCSVVCLLLLFTTASSVDSCDPKITQDPQLFIIDGQNSTLKLTCNDTVATEFYWIYNTTLGERLPCTEVGFRMNTCTYQPRRETANQQVRCRAASSINTDIFCTPNIQYPPQSDPNITSTARGRPLQQGDVLTCSVSGGRPPDTTINFTCSDPNMNDQPDVINNVTVSSNMTVNVSQAGQETLTCTCSATWNPQQGLYNGTATNTFDITFTDLASFTINNSTSVDVPINQSVVLNCAARGRPAPNVTLYDARGNVIMTRKGQNTGNSMDIVETSYDFLLNVTEVSQTGHYKCMVNNDVSMPAENMTFLGVPSKPKALDNFPDPNDPPVLKDSLNFTLQAYPPPTITISHNGEVMNRRRRSTGNHFNASCQSVEGMEYLASCTITVIHTEVNGTFQGVAQNTQGSIAFQFKINDIVTTTTTTTATTTTSVGVASAGTNEVAIIAGVGGGGVLIGVLIGVLVIRHRRKKHDVDKRDDTAGAPVPMSDHTKTQTHDVREQATLEDEGDYGKLRVALRHDVSPTPQAGDMYDHIGHLRPPTDNQ